MNRWIIKLGRICPTDCTLILVTPDGVANEALIESQAWKALSAIWSLGDTGCDDPWGIPEHGNLAVVLKAINDHLSFVE